MSQPNKLRRQSTVSTFTFGLDDSSRISNIIAKTRSVNESKGVLPHVSPNYGIEVYEKNIIETPHSVNNYPIEVQLDFRKKMYGLLSLELLLTVLFGTGFMFMFNVVDLTTITNMQILNKVLICLSTLIPIIFNLYMLYISRHSYPYNFLSLCSFSLIKGISIGFVSNVINIEILILHYVLFILSLFMLYLSLIVFDKNTKFIRIMKVSNIGGIAWVLYAFIFLIVYHVTDLGISESLLIRQFIFITSILMWYSYDANVLMKKLSIDEYMNGIIFLYTDMIVLLILLTTVMIGMLNGDNSNELVNVGPDPNVINNVIMTTDLNNKKDCIEV